MATYAAYRHIELDKVGYGKKRVLKPPGGGSSDIFGTTSSGQENNTRRVKNHMASSVFLNDDPATNNTSAGGATATPAKQSEHMNGDNIDSAGHDEPVVNGNSSTPVTNGNRTMNGTSNAARARVPPGGFSSGLW